MNRHQRRAEQAEAQKRGYHERMASQAESLRSIGLVGPGSLTHFIIRHDDWCPRLRGGQCLCHPEISSTPDFPHHLYRK